MSVQKKVWNLIEYITYIYRNLLILNSFIFQLSSDGCLFYDYLIYVKVDGNMDTTELTLRLNEIWTLNFDDLDI